MQQPIIQIRDRLFAGLDQDYNVVDMDIVVDVLSQLENYAITKEALEATRLGKHINELRRKAQDKLLANRAKSLVKKWRQLLVVPSSSTTVATTTTTATTVASARPAVTAQVPAPSGELPPGGGGGGGGSSTVAAPPSSTASSSNNNDKRHNGTLNRRHLSPNVRPPPPPPPPPVPPTPPLQNAMAAAVPSNGRHHHHHQQQQPVTSPNFNHLGSSLPSSASTSPGLTLSRPVTPASTTTTSRPVSPIVIVDEDPVSRTHAANKRLRKSTESSPELNSSNKRLRLANGDDLYSDNSSSVNIVPEQQQKQQQQQQQTEAQQQQQQPTTTTITKRKTRRLKKQEVHEDVLQRQMESVRKAAGKVLTTQDLVNQLAIRSAQSPALRPQVPSPAAAAAAAAAAASNASASASQQTAPKSNLSPSQQETKTELMNRFFESQLDSSSSSPPVPPPTSRVASGGDESTTVSSAPTPEPGGEDTVESILSQLPPINREEILAEIQRQIDKEGDDDDDDEEEDDGEDIVGLIPVKKPEVEISDEMVADLHEKQKESLAGNFNHIGEFCEWHEPVEKPTKDGDLLYILPYCVID